MSTQVKRLIVNALRAIEDEQSTDTVKSTAAKCRAGKKAIAGHFDPEAAWQLRKLALDRRVTVQVLLEEALGDLFEKHHLPRTL